MPTSRRRVVTQRNTRPPTAHWRRTVAASRFMLAGARGGARRRRYRRPVARPPLGVVVGLALALALPAGCSGGDRPSTGAEGTPTTDARDRDLPPEVDAFLERAAGGQDTSFEASYDVLRKLGGVRSTASV